MLYHVALYLQPYWSALNVIHYVSVRAIMALLASLICSLVSGSWFIEKSKSLFRAKARENTPDTHRAKDYTPTMGGLFILMTVICNVLIWCNLTEPKVWLMLLCLIGFGIIGALDDISKIRVKKGISARTKCGLQLLVALAVTVAWLYGGGTTTIAVPFAKHMHPDIGLFFIIWSMFVLVGTSNAVNLTDGLDGLAIGSLLPNFVLFSLICYLAGHKLLAFYLGIPFTGTAEITVIGASLIGASLGFLWYNTYPAQIFMGDVGSLSLGAGLGCMALMSKSELLLIIAGGLFVVETLSVILQVLSFRFRAKRIFKMAPIHHHFELLGWQESKITTRFGIISLVLCLLALITLKLR
ncbi:MAG: phospho-N-acetylmuramoyl-pentapeptide-transferase [Candidatus Dependentiae bacterium]|nr:phospho-N-acetylmuramoyl-pentapeptide-transferase [Candidatus Dependentiae bacterium]